jgi:hypothetical protein
MSTFGYRNNPGLRPFIKHLGRATQPGTSGTNNQQVAFKC